MIQTSFLSTARFAPKTVNILSLSHILRNRVNHYNEDLHGSSKTQLWFSILYKGLSCYLPVFKPNLPEVIMTRLQASLPTSLSISSFGRLPVIRSSLIPDTYLSTRLFERKSLRLRPTISYITPRTSPLTLGGKILSSPVATLTLQALNNLNVRSQIWFQISLRLI